jgi:hypothetical protein
MRAKFTVFLRIAAGQASFQTLVAVAIFILIAIKYTLSFWMIAAVKFIYHGGSSLLEKSLWVKMCLRVTCPWSVGRCLSKAVLGKCCCSEFGRPAQSFGL